jgi:hypothetical protein
MNQADFYLLALESAKQADSNYAKLLRNAYGDAANDRRYIRPDLLPEPIQSARRAKFQADDLMHLQLRLMREAGLRVTDATLIQNQEAK